MTTTSRRASLSGGALLRVRKRRLIDFVGDVFADPGTSLVQF